jgi:hypothetical protein
MSLIQIEFQKNVFNTISLNIAIYCQNPIYRGLFGLSNEVKSTTLPSSNIALQLVNLVRARVAFITDDNTNNKPINFTLNIFILFKLVYQF